MKTKAPHNVPGFKGAESGSALLSVLFSIFLLGVSTLLIIDGVKIFMKDRAQIDYLASRSSLKRMLMTATDCQQLKPCFPDDGVSIFDSKGSVLIKGDASTRFRSLRVRAVCTKSSIIQISAMPWTASGSSVDPLSGKPLNWSDPNLLLVDTSQICPAPLASDRLKIINGPLCKAEKGTCLPPTSSSIEKICCPDGRDAPKPKCPSKTREAGAYWDRLNDLGSDGFWVVFCQ